MDRVNTFINGHALPTFWENDELVIIKDMFLTGCKLNDDSTGIPISVYLVPWIEYAEKLVVGAVRNGLQPEKRVGFPVCPKQYRAKGVSEKQLIEDAKTHVGECDFYEVYRIESVRL